MRNKKQYQLVSYYQDFFEQETEHLPLFLKKFLEDTYHQNEKFNKIKHRTNSGNNEFSLERPSREVPR